MNTTKTDKYLYVITIRSFSQLIDIEQAGCQLVKAGQLFAEFIATEQQVLTLPFQVRRG